MVIVKKSMLVAAIVGTVLVTGCSEQQSSEHNSRSKMLIAQSKLVQDNHSFSKPNEIRVSHLDWDAEVVFETKTIRAVATYDIQHIAAADQIIFDVKKLNIEKVLVDGQPVNFEIGEEKEFLGSPLKINVKSDSKKVAIHYTTSPGAEALLWVDGEKPFLFTQSQAILARTWIPCQDSPGLLTMRM
jgi:aminopeptidase N